MAELQTRGKCLIAGAFISLDISFCRWTKIQDETTFHLLIAVDHKHIPRFILHINESLKLQLVLYRLVHCRDSSNCLGCGVTGSLAHCADLPGCTNFFHLSPPEPWSV